jgi:TolB protein
MHAFLTGPRVSARAARLALFAGATVFAACSDQSPPSAPVVPAAPSLGVNNGGNNRRILFERQSAIYSMNPDGTDVTQLTFPTPANPFTDYTPAWSPDGKRIAFARLDAEDPDGEIYVMNADGSNVTRLTYSPGNDLSPTWSKDGKRIAFVSARGADIPVLSSWEDWDIYYMDAATGGAVTRVTEQPGADFDPSWSPDGKQIAFVSQRDGGAAETTDLYAVNLDNLAVTRLTTLGLAAVQPSWAPGGKQIAFTAGNFEAGEADIYVLTLDGLLLTRITDGTATPGNDEAPSWSPDGKQIVFASTRANAAREIYTMNADGRAVTRLTNNSVDDLNPAWNR